MNGQSTNRIRTGLLTAAIAGGAVLGATQLGGIVNAQTDETPAESQPDEVPADDATDDTTDTGGDDLPGRGERGQELADLLGIERAELLEDLRGGATLAEIAEANGVEVQAVVDHLVEQANERIDRAVENGRLDTTEADEKRAEVEERVNTAVTEGGEGVFGGRSGGRGPGGADRGAQCDEPADETATDEAEVESLDVDPTASLTLVES